MKQTVLCIVSLIVLSCNFHVPLLSAQNNAITINTPLEQITLENLDRIQELAVIGVGDVWNISWSPNGEQLLVATDSGTYVYDPSSLSSIPLRLDNYSTDGLMFDPTGSLLAVGSNLLPVVTIWNANEWTAPQSFTTLAHGHQIAFSLGNSYLSVGTARNDLYFWDIRTGIQVGYINYVGSDLRDVIFHPNGADVITAGVNFDNVRIWSFDVLRSLFNNPNDEEYVVFPTPGLIHTIDETLYSVVIDHEHKQLIGIAENALQFRDLDTYELVDSLSVPTDYSDQIQITQDQRSLVLSHYGELFIWNLDNVLASDDPGVRTITVQSGSSFSVNPDGSLLAVSDSETLEVRALDSEVIDSLDLSQICAVVPIGAMDVEIVRSEIIVSGCNESLRWQLQVPEIDEINAHFYGNTMRDAIVVEGMFEVQPRNREETSVFINVPDFLRIWFDSPIVNKDKRWLAFGSPFSGIHFWNVATGELVHSVTATDTRNIFLSEDEHLLITFGNEIGYYPTIKLWGVPSDK